MDDDADSDEDEEDEEQDTAFENHTSEGTIPDIDACLSEAGTQNHVSEKVRPNANTLNISVVANPSSITIDRHNNITVTTIDGIWDRQTPQGTGTTPYQESLH